MYKRQALAAAVFGLLVLVFVGGTVTLLVGVVSFLFELLLAELEMLVLIGLRFPSTSCPTFRLDCPAFFTTKTRPTGAVSSSFISFSSFALADGTEPLEALGAGFNDVFEVLLAARGAKAFNNGELFADF